MLQIQDTIVSLDLLRECFCCDLAACKGMCCEEGDGGAPLTEEEQQTAQTHIVLFVPGPHHGIQEIHSRGRCRRCLYRS